MVNDKKILAKIYKLKDELIQIVQFAIEVAKNEKKSNRTSKYNMTVDIKDNLHDSLKSLAQEQGIEYHRSNLSQYFVINNQKVKIKFHNCLCKAKREIIEQAETPQLKLPLECIMNTPIIKESEWEIGIQTSTERTALNIIRIADFSNKIIETVFNHKLNIVQFPKTTNAENKENKDKQEIKNKIKTKNEYKIKNENENKGNIKNDI